MPTQVGSDDPEMPSEWREDLPPVQRGRARHPVDKHQGSRARRPGALPHPGRPAAGQLHPPRKWHSFYAKHPTFLLSLRPGLSPATWRMAA